MNAQEANGEQREKNGGKFAETDDFGRAVLKRKPPERLYAVLCGT